MKKDITNLRTDANRGFFPSAGPPRFTASVLPEINLGVGAERFSFQSQDGAGLYAMTVLPAHGDGLKQDPQLVLLHGGPQTMWANAWGYEWNAQVFTGGGYVTLMNNRRGPAWYGQNFPDEI